MFSRGLLAAAMAAAVCSPAAANGYGASSITMRHLNLKAGEWSGPVIEEEILTGPRLFLRNAGEAMQGFKKKLGDWPRISNNRQMLADAAPGAATLQAPNQEQQSAGMRPNSSTVLKVFPIKGDGRCMFRSISRSLAHAEGRKLNERMETKDADALRKAAWQVICVDKRQAFEEARVIEGDMGAYCSRMQDPSFFGGEPELFVIAEELQQTITVYVPQQGGFKPIVEYGSRYLKERPRIRILYNGNNHYDALLD